MNGNERADAPPGFVELQLLRHGPPHNQLLSPLTEYLALCADHPNTTLRIPLEQSALETRLRALRYFDSEQTRVDQLRETARIASDILAKVPGLIAELSSDWADGVPFVHLSIASRASELALVPFELAVSPDGFPGAGQPLCLQKQMPVCLTRRSRNVRNDAFVWDRPVKILLVASDAGGEIPIVQHYALLRKLVEPLVGTMPVDDEEDKQDKVRTVLRLLTQATVDKIARVLCDEVDLTGDPFTHIHVLAHGCDLPESDRRSGVALHHPTKTKPGDFDAVDGKRLAETLGCLPDFPATAKRYQGPAVVTLATCGSADQGSVKISGASLAFELHDTGIPLVVGSQFPLTQAGSIIMTDSLYRGFLAGRDPRSTIWETRRALLANLSQKPGSSDAIERSAHDWASLTVYAALPHNLDQVLPAHRRRQKQRRLDVRLVNIHRLMWLMGRRKVAFDEWSKAAHEVRNQARKFGEWARTHESGDEAARVSNSGILASAQKQIGLLWLQAATDMVPENEWPTGWAEAGEEWLRASRSEYRRVFEISRNNTWALVQFLVLDFALRGNFDDAEWNTARQLALIDKNAQNPQRCVDALSSLLELEFLRCLKAAFNDQSPAMDGNVGELAKRIDSLFREAPYAVRSAKRQFQRYVDDFAELAFFASVDSDVGHFEERFRQRQAARKKRKHADHVLKGKPGYRAVAAIEQILQFFPDVR